VTAHARSMLERLPLLYRDGDLVVSLLGVLGLQIEILDEEARRVQRRHWFDTAPDFDDAARLGTLLDIEPEAWQSLPEYRAWFHALRTARLRHGAGTVAALQAFVRDYAESFERADAMEVVAPFDEWSPTPTRFGHAFVEQPARARTAVFGDRPGIEPLHQQEVVNGGLDPSPLSWVVTGTAAGPEYMPVVANLTTARALVYLGALPPGARLWVTARTDGSAQADLEGRDVSDRLRTVSRFEAGRPWTPEEAESPAPALTLAPGPNELWFLPVAHYDEPGLDRVLLALADLDLRQGRWDETTFGHSLFYQDPAAVAQLLWQETTPATVQVDLDASTLRSPAGALDESMENRDQLAASLDEGVSSLAAAGVAADVRLRPLATSQRQRDRLVAYMPRTVREAGVTGVDRMPDMGGLYGVSDFGDSTYR